MTINQMLAQSGLLTGLGMAVVFGFIIILILCMKLLQVFVKVTKLDKKEEQSNTTTAAPVKDDKSVVAAIVAAIKSKQ